MKPLNTKHESINNNVWYIYGMKVLNGILFFLLEKKFIHSTEEYHFVNGNGKIVLGALFIFHYAQQGREITYN